MTTPTERRINLLRGGYSPIPVSGKIPSLERWQTKTTTNKGEIELWAKDFSYAKNDGLLTRKMPTLDIDILNEEASEAVEALIRERFEDRGNILVRIGRAPKRAIPFRTSTPFDKITANLVAPNGDTGQKLELLADGQQVVAFGIHEDTHEPYTWHGGEPGQVKREQLPPIDEAEARQLVDDAAKLLCDKFGYTRKTASANSKDGNSEDWGPLLANVLDGHELHNSTRDLAAKFVVSGMNGGAAVRLTRAVMEASTAPRDARFQERYDDIPRAVSTAEEKYGDQDIAALTLQPHSFPNEKTIAQWDFLYGHHLLRRTVSGTAAMGSTGKTSLSLIEALAMASGKDLLGEDVAEKPLRVLLICLEDNRNAMDKRIVAAMKHHNLTAKDIGGRLFVLAKGEIKFKIARLVKGSVKRNTDLVEQIIELLIEKKIDVLSLDPFIKTHGVPENDNNAISDVVECYDEISERANCAVSLWHHTRKGNAMGATIDSARGASSFIDACRSVRVLETMTAEEAKKQKIENHKHYFRIFSGKLNFAPPSDKSTWYRIASVPVLNGPLDHFQIDGGNGGDNVGVIECWELPNTVDVEVTPEQTAAIKAAVKQGEWREDMRAGMWVGKAIAQVLALDAEDNKPRLRQLVKKLMSEGELKVIPGKTSDHKSCLFVVARDWIPPVIELADKKKPPK